MHINDDPLADIRSEVEAEMAKDAAADEKAEVAAKGKADAGDETEDEEVEQTAKGKKAGAKADADEDEETDEQPRKPEGKKRDWKRERINEYRAKLTDKESTIAELRAQVAALQSAPAASEDADETEDTAEQPKPKPRIQPRQKTEAEIRVEVEAKMVRDAAIKAFTDDSNAAFDAGVKAYGKEDFEDATDTLRDVGLNEGILEAVLATDAPEKVLYLLGQDPDEASRIFALPPLKRATAMAKVAASRAKPGKVSDAPAPIRPVGGKGGENDELNNDASDAIVEKHLNGAMERIAAKWH